MEEDFFFNRIETQFNAKLPFVVYRKPNTKDIKGIIQNNDTLFFVNDFTEKGFVFSPFDDSEKTVLIPLETSEIISTTQASNYSNNSNVTSSFSESISINSKENHINLIKKGIDAIHDNQFKKVVLSRKEVVTISQNNPFQIFKNLVENYPSAFAYCWYHPKVGLWLGATPETLFKIEDNRFSMMALAGTQDYNGTLNVIWQNKEQQEQQYVTDFILDSLKNYITNIKVTPVETVKAGNLLHLRTKVTGVLNLETINLEQLLRLLHPTPAVCGLPKENAKLFILENEDYDRLFYTGFFGELNLDNKISPRMGKSNIENNAYSRTVKSTQLYVNLRCMQLQDNKASIYIGGGITQSSDPEKEWEETVSKSLVIKNAL